MTSESGSSDCDCLMWKGRVLQTLGAETRKAREPNDRLWVRGTKSSWVEDERVNFGVMWNCIRSARYGKYLRAAVNVLQCNTRPEDVMSRPLLQIIVRLSYKRAHHWGKLTREWLKCVVRTATITETLYTHINSLFYCHTQGHVWNLF